MSYLKIRIWKLNKHRKNGNKYLYKNEERERYYGYTTKAFNQQVKNNAEKFDEDFMFQLTKDEWENLRSNFLTSSWGGARYLPSAFTEQGIYMLMTVLRGELAVRQSKELIRTFKKMKDYVLENRELAVERDFLKVFMQVSNSITQTIRYQSNLHNR